jgi:hypothetical protein
MLVDRRVIIEFSSPTVDIGQFDFILFSHKTSGTWRSGVAFRIYDVAQFDLGLLRQSYELQF